MKKEFEEKSKELQENFEEKEKDLEEKAKEMQENFEEKAKELDEKIKGLQEKEKILEEKSKKDSRKKIAINMLNKNLQIELISECTKISIEELKKIKEEINE